MEFAEGTFVGLADSEVELFRKVLKGISGVGVEIGCCDGYSSAIILDASELHLTSIDPFIPDSMESSLIGSITRFAENIKPFGARAELIDDYSYNAIPSQRWSNYMDFLFIDGDHRYEEVLRDFMEWTPLIYKGGLLAMHDCRMGRDGGAPFHEGPSRVAQERIFGKPEEWKILSEAFSLVICEKL